MLVACTARGVVPRQVGNGGAPVEAMDSQRARATGDGCSGSIVSVLRTQLPGPEEPRGLLPVEGHIQDRAVMVVEHEGHDGLVDPGFAFLQIVRGQGGTEEAVVHQLGSRVCRVREGQGRSVESSREHDLAVAVVHENLLATHFHPPVVLGDLVQHMDASVTRSSCT